MENTVKNAVYIDTLNNNWYVSALAVSRGCYQVKDNYYSSEFQLSEQIQTTSIDDVNHDKADGLSCDFGWSS